MAVVGPTVQTHTFVFYADGKEVHRVILKAGETLNQSPNPEKEDHRFVGWYADEGFNTPFTAFGENTSFTADDGATDVYAKFEKVFYIQYLDQNDNVIRTDEAAEGESYTFDKDDPLFDTGLSKTNMGWKDQDNVEHTNTSNTTITVTKDLTLTPILQDGWTVRFDTQGGSAVISQIVAPGGYAAKPDDPTHMGYSFDGWFTAAQGGDAFFDATGQSVSPINESTVVYAQWTPDEATYIVAIWIETADDPDKYDFGTSFPKTSTTGADVEYTTTAPTPTRIGTRSRRSPIARTPATISSSRSIS